LIWIKKAFFRLSIKFKFGVSNSVCNSLGIPSYLHRSGRAIDNEFIDEFIFRRFLATGAKIDWMKDNQLSSSIFEVKNDSCNRSKYSNSPEDVLYNVRIEDEGKHYFSWGILSIGTKAFSIFTFKVNGTTRTFSLQLSHDPLECMFPHSEIIVLEVGFRIDTNKPKSVKTAIRDFLITECKIVKYPS